MLDAVQRHRADFTGAACATVDPDLFFTEKTNKKTQNLVKNICNECPALAECREYAIVTPGIEWGVWGGMSVRELRRARKKYREENGIPEAEHRGYPTPFSHTAWGSAEL